MKVNVHIERLVIESGERITREQLTEAIRRELDARISAKPLAGRQCASGAAALSDKPVTRSISGTGEGLPTQLRASGMRDATAAQAIKSRGAGLGDAIYGSLQS
jgi:hypothetical protein